MAKTNTLNIANPRLCQEWHPTKNGDLTPEMVTVGSTQKVWWYLPYDDPATGKHFDFEWEATISNRNNGSGCPYIAPRKTKAWPGFNDLATLRPDIAAEWHPTKNGDLTPEKVTVSSARKVWWYLPYDDPKTKKHFDFEWEAAVYERTKGNGCPYLAKKGSWAGFNDLASKRPKIAAEWHPTKNGDLTPEQVRVSSNKKVWWLLPYDDPETGKHFDFEWEATISSRVGGSSCPYLSVRPSAWPGFNDLASLRPDIAIEWHPTKNGDLTPNKVTLGSNRKVWWLLPYDDPKTGKHFDFEWEASVSSRINGSRCPYLAGRAIWPGFNDLLSNYPEVAVCWHPTKNGDLTPDKVSCSSEKKYWWLQDGKECQSSVARYKLQTLRLRRPS